MTVCRVHLIFRPHNCREAVTFEAPKVTKSAPSAEGFLAAQAFPLQTRQNQGYAYFAGRTLHFRTLHAKTLMPCHAPACIVLPGFGRS